MRICVAGEGAIARKHLDGIARIGGIEVASLVGGNPADTEEFATERGNYLMVLRRQGGNP